MLGTGGLMQGGVAAPTGASIVPLVAFQNTFNNSTFSEFTIGVNWSHQYTTPFDDAALASNQVSQAANRSSWL